MVLFCLIPASIAIIYAVLVQLKHRHTLNVHLLAAGGAIALCNAGIMFEFFEEMTVSAPLRCLQQVLSCMIVPIAYMYFAAQMGREWLNSITITLWSLLLLLLLPPSYYSLDYSAHYISLEMNVMPMTIHFVHKGTDIYRMYTADLVVFLQGFITLVRMIVMIKIMRRYNLSISPRIRYFFIWWAASIVFIIFTSTHNTEEMRQPLLLWAYYIGYSVLIVAIYILFSLNINLHPILLAITNAEDEVSDREEEVNDEEHPNEEILVNVDSFLRQSKAMAERMKIMMNDEKCYLNASFTADTAIRELGTNRTYFYRMVKAEFGCTFNELVLQNRMQSAMSKLTGSHKSIQEIALECGFSDHTSFSRRFKQTYGMTPSQYREDSSKGN